MAKKQDREAEKMIADLEKNPGIPEKDRLTQWMIDQNNCLGPGVAVDDQLAGEFKEFLDKQQHDSSGN